MKIKRLTIRNIASIEKADIDFEKDLIDSSTQTPAKIFLIAGDTGAGKSVLLDAISMALYKKTPRIISAPNANNNKFTNRQGEEISVNSISQYTRIGISEKDDCYSEVVFEGNDGNTYHAKLTLGRQKTRKKGQNGEPVLKYKTPLWQVRIGEQDWQKVEGNTGQPILDAIGLTFEQFGRMAMLAQGQFASFLIGDKKERESILEQLTNTELFSRYGEAIKRLYAKANEEYRLKDKLYEKEKTNTLTEEEVKRLNTEKEIAIKTQEEEQKSLDDVAKLINDIKQIENIVRNKERATREREAQQKILEGDSFVEKEKLVKDLEETSEQRRKLEELHEQKTNLIAVKNRIDREKSKFQILCNDLAHRKEELGLLRKKIEETKIWLKEKTEFVDIYANAGEIGLKIANRNAEINKEKAADEGMEKLKQSIESQISVVAKEKERSEEAGKATKEQQARIDLLIKKREEQNPSNIRAEIGKQSQKLNGLKELKLLLVTWEEQKKEHCSLCKEIEEDDKLLEQLKVEQRVASSEYDKAKENADRARNLLSIMKLSIEETLTTLRKKLKEKHVETCPLCGQRIEKLHFEEEFRTSITPLEDEQQKAEAELSQKEKNLNDVTKKYNERLGQKSTKEKEVAKRENTLRKKEQEVREKCSLNDLEVKDGISSEVEKRLETTTKALETAQEQQNQVDKIQREIDSLLLEKKDLDATKESSEKKYASEERKLNQYQSDIQHLSKQQEESRKKINDITDDLNQQLGKHYPCWTENSQNVGDTIKHEAIAYNHRKEESDKLHIKEARDKEIIEQISETKDRILKHQPTWETEPQSEAFASTDIRKEWNNTFTNIIDGSSKQKNCQQCMESIMKFLQDYYQKSGSTENQLSKLNEKKHLLESTRKEIEQERQTLKSKQELIKSYQKNIDELLKAMNVEKAEDLPDKDSLTKRKNELSTTIGERNILIGRLVEQLNTNQNNTEKLRQAELEKEKAKDKAKKWDKFNRVFGGTRFRTLVQTHILRPLLNNANIYLSRITDRYTLTCSEENEQLSILVLDNYNKQQVRSATVLSGGERFMLSIALSLALSSLNRQDMNINILFIDEGFGTLDEKSLDSVMSTLERLQEIAGQNERRVGIISHREELEERIPTQIKVRKKGEGRSIVEIENA